MCVACKKSVFKIAATEQSARQPYKTRRRMARERRGAGSSLVSMETQFYKQYMKDVL